MRDRRLLDGGIAELDGQPSLPPSRFLGEPSVGDARIDDFTAQLAVEHAVNRDWTLSLQVERQVGRLAGVEIDATDVVATRLVREAQLRDEGSRALLGQFEVAGRFLAAGRYQHLTAGVQALSVNEDVNRFVSDSARTPFTLDAYAPRYGQPLPALAAERLSREHSLTLSAYVKSLCRFARHAISISAWRALTAARDRQVSKPVS